MIKHTAIWLLFFSPLTAAIIPGLVRRHNRAMSMRNMNPQLEPEDKFLAEETFRSLYQNGTRIKYGVFTEIITEPNALSEEVSS